MTKYSYELKKKVVSAYLNDEGGYEYLSKKYDISHHDIVRRWVKCKCQAKMYKKGK